MELGGIKNIIFDLGGVLLNLDFDLTKQAFIKLGVKGFDNYFTQAQQNGLFDLYETGQLTETEFCVEIRTLTNIEATQEEIIDAWNAMMLDFPKVRKELLLELKKHFSITLLSNTNETHIKAFNKIIQKDINENSLAPLFHETYYSNIIGVNKPHKEAFEYVLKQNNYVAGETLFLDDTIRHIEGAKKCGIQTVHIDKISVEKLFADFLA